LANEKIIFQKALKCLLTFYFKFYNLF
jgi:hypothetical protein